MQAPRGYIEDLGFVPNGKTGGKMYPPRPEFSAVNPLMNPALRDGTLKLISYGKVGASERACMYGQQIDRPI